ncbi:SDR family NAD(P)-dependent oxidoreductase [Terricaulis silvestris]|uniref:D-xylose 1-dehydrogenase n=1 Tax=Terricaulis silvestris TaxID=2686094 RepID=A0A6I6MQ02_9CAUL|nr:SDR family oxidoreductase [Terricaulis silvestris]QGZ94914.1 Glucose 1-dehydrogenase 4 [Terricaulis silvestris]
MELKGKTVLVTGASRGLGRACAIAFAKSGAQIVGTGRDASALAETAAALEALGAQFQLAEIDVTDEAEVIGLVQSLDRIDVLVNNAGIARVAPLLDCSTDEVREIFNINVLGAFIVMREAARKMADQGAGDIINIASDGALRGLPRMSAYAASKHALLGLSRSARLELRPLGIRVLCVCPGAINTTILGEGVEGAINSESLAQLIVRLTEAHRDLVCSELLVQSADLGMAM